MQDAILNELLDGQYAAARDRFADGQHSHEDLTIIMLKHQTNHIAHLDQDVHAKLDKLDEKIEAVKNSLDEKIEAVKNSLDEKIEAVNNSLDGKIEGVNNSLEVKIQGVKDSLNRSINTLTWRMMLAMGLMTSVFTFVVKFQ